MKKKDLKTKLNKRENTIGTWLTIPDNNIAEIFSKSSFDWVVIDMEHSGISNSQCLELIRTIDLSNCTPLVRLQILI